MSGGSWLLARAAGASRQTRHLSVCSVQRGLFSNKLNSLVQRTLHRPEANDTTKGSKDQRKPNTKSRLSRSIPSSGGMHISMALRARNIDKAWDICVKTLWRDIFVDTPVDAIPRSTLVELVMLMTENNSSQNAYRVCKILDHLFSQEIPKLGLSTSAEYEQMLESLSISSVYSHHGGMSASRLASLVLMAAAQQDKVEVTTPMLQIALDTAIARKDKVAACDILNVCFSDLAVLLDSQTSDSNGNSEALKAPQSDRTQMVVEKMLALVAVGQGKNVVDSAIEQPQDDLPHDQFDRLVDVQRDNLAETTTDGETKRWRAETAERIYKAYVGAGISEIPSPDGSSRPALQASVVPSATMLTTLIGIHAGAGDVEQTAILYDSLIASIHQQPLPDQGNHRLSIDVWDQIVASICLTKQSWLALRVLAEIIADRWVPTSIMYGRCLMTLDDSTKETSIGQFCSYIKDQHQSDVEILQPLIVALVHPALNKVPMNQLVERIKKAYNLCMADDQVPLQGVSDKVIRELVRAMIRTDNMEEMQQIAEEWGAKRPELLTSRNLAEIILGWGNQGEYTQALTLFTNIQQEMGEQMDLDLLCAVQQVYVMAGDFEEAASVGKRIRALVQRNVETNDAHAAQLVDLTIYNSIMKAYCELEDPTEALRVLEEMRSYGLGATPASYTMLVKLMSKLRSYEGLKLVTALVNVDYNMQDIESSHLATTGQQVSETPSKLTTLPLDTAYFNALIEAYGRVAEPGKALQTWEVMRLRGIKPDCETATQLIDICGWNERVHWEEDMDDSLAEFTGREAPEDHVFTGMTFIHMHFLADTLQKLGQAGLEFSVANYRHILEALIRVGFLEDAMDMVIGRFEDVDGRNQWEAKLQAILNPEREGDPLLEGLSTLMKNLRNRDGKNKEGDDESALAKYMDDFSLEIPLCNQTVMALYGSIDFVRSQCNPDEDADMHDIPFVQRATPHFLQRLDLHQERLDDFLARHGMDIIEK